MYDLLQHVYVDAIIQKSRKTDESGALTSMVDRSTALNVLLLADRGYEGYNNLAHIQEKGWSFLIRIKNAKAGIVSGLSLPESNEFDIPFHLKLTNKQTNAVKPLLQDRNHYKFVPSTSRFDYLPSKSRKSGPTQFYDLHFRIVRFPISESTCETIITNLDKDAFPIQQIKRLYTMRWGIETSFRDLKYALALLHLHAKKGGLHLPRNLCKAHHVQLLSNDYPVRSHPKRKKKILLQGLFLRCRTYLSAILPR